MVRIASAGTLIAKPGAQALCVLSFGSRLFPPLPHFDEERRILTPTALLNRPTTDALYSYGMAIARKPRRPGLSGAESEAGGAYRAAVAAYVATHLLRGEPLRELDLLDDHDAVPITVELETDDPVDDIGISLQGGGRAF